MDSAYCLNRLFEGELSEETAGPNVPNKTFLGKMVPAMMFLGKIFPLLENYSAYSAA